MKKNITTQFYFSLVIALVLAVGFTQQRGWCPGTAPPPPPPGGPGFLGTSGDETVQPTEVITDSEGRIIEWGELSIEYDDANGTYKVISADGSYQVFDDGDDDRSLTEDDVLLQSVSELK